MTLIRVPDVYDKKYLVFGCHVRKFATAIALCNMFYTFFGTPIEFYQAAINGVSRKYAWYLIASFVAHLIGFIVALLVNFGDKNEKPSLYLPQIMLFIVLIIIITKSYLSFFFSALETGGSAFWFNLATIVFVVCDGLLLFSCIITMKARAYLRDEIVPKKVAIQKCSEQDCA